MKVKGKYFVVLWLAILLISLFAGAAPAQEVFQFQAHSMKLEILPESIFEARFGDNPDVPRTDAAIIALARKLYPSPRVMQPEAAAPVQECREYELGVLFAALKNPAISDLTRRQVDLIIQETVPALPLTYTSGHFKIHYTQNDPDPRNNAYIYDIEATAAKLNEYWKKYRRNFKTPKYYVADGKQMIDVNVYYLGDTLSGETSSYWDYINLHSKLTVQNQCRRQTVSAHELFHRVQYSYGHISGTARMQWIVEGTAAWAQKYTNQGVRDYMPRMNQGLDAPERHLFKRSYDACHFWVYLQELAGTWAPIQEVWAAYEGNGNNAKAAVNTVTKKFLDYSFDDFVQAWVKTNYIKDLDNAYRDGYDYDEDEVEYGGCGVLYGPLSHVPRTTLPLYGEGPIHAWEGSIDPYGAHYYEFPMGTAPGYGDVTNLIVKVKGAEGGNFSYHLIGIKNNRWKAILNKTWSFTYDRPLAPYQWDKVAVVVAGRSKGGDYTITVAPCSSDITDVTGDWSDGRNIWHLEQNGGSVTGTFEDVDHLPEDQYIFPVTGTYDAETRKLDLYVNGGLNYCSYHFTAWLTTCNGFEGPFITSGPAWCTGSGYYSIHRQGAASPASLSLGEMEPGCRECN